MNVGFFLENTASKYPGTIAIVDHAGRCTFAELEDRCAKLGGALLAAGLKPGDRVAMLFYNTKCMVESYFAALRVGLVACPVNFRLSGREMSFILNDSGSKAFLYSQEFQPQVDKIKDQLSGVELFVSSGPDAGTSARDYESFLAEGDRAPNDPNTSEDHPCQIMYTSGTTGRPKGAVISHRNVIWNLFNTIHGRDDRSGQVSIIVGPLYHTAALNNHLTIQVSLGGTSILIKKFEAEELLQTIQAEKATLISGSPAMYNLLMNHPRSADYDKSSITKCTSGADKLPMETKKLLMEFFPNIKGVYDVYGCTEASPCITILNAADSLRKDLSVGRPLPFLEARVVDENGAQLPPGRVGELICRGPNVMVEYHNQPQATQDTIRDGWLYTGDLARADEEGFFYIVDRKKDMLVSGGENIYPREVEEVLYSHPDVLEVAVVGMPDQTWGESVLAYVVKKQSSHTSEEELIEFCKQRLASYKKPKRIEFLDALPRNASGKVLKKDLRRIKLEAGEAGTPTQKKQPEDK